MNTKIKNAKIISIDGDYYDYDKDGNMIGLKIETDKGDIKLLISNSSQCCEDWGCLFFETADDVDRFIGAKILDIKSVEIDGISASGYNLDSGSETQLKITTNKGVLQYAVYNSHNGYYSHARILQILDDIDENYL